MALLRRKQPEALVTQSFFDQHILVDRPPGLPGIQMTVIRPYTLYYRKMRTLVETECHPEVSVVVNTVHVLKVASITTLKEILDIHSGFDFLSLAGVIRNGIQHTLGVILLKPGNK